jgi:hypothetical protein
MTTASGIWFFLSMQNFKLFGRMLLTFDLAAKYQPRVVVPDCDASDQS